MNDNQKENYEINQLQHEYFILYKTINRNDISKINKNIIESKDLSYVTRSMGGSDSHCPSTHSTYGMDDVS